MAKTTAWLMTLIGLVWVVNLAQPSLIPMPEWIIGLSFVAIGVTKLIRAYNYKKRR